MKAHVKQIAGLSVFAAACMALGMGLSRHWVAQAQEERPVVVDAKGLDRLPPIAEVAEKLNPTVVAITNTSFVKRQRSAFEGPGDDFFHWFFGPGRPRQQQPNGEDDVQRLQAGGSGVVISPDGEILTNHHVVEGIRGGEAEIQVKLSDGRTFKAKVLGKDKELDIALIKIEGNRMPFAKLGDSDAAKVGEWVVAIGNPLGLEHTVTQGIISAKGRSLGNAGLESFLQTDAAINRGNSGGPLLNLRGEIIGINTAINPAGQNIGFAVPVNMVKNILKDLRAGKPVSRGYLGVTPVELDKGFQESLGVKQGVVVNEVQRGQAADKAGLQALDVITAVEGQPVKAPEDLIAAIAGRRSGDTVKLTLWRDGKSLDRNVTLGDRAQLKQGQDEDEEDSAPSKKEDDGKKLNLEKVYGFKVEALTPALRHQFGVEESVKGVVVTSVVPRSPAGEKLMPGLIITGVNKRPAESLESFQAEVKKAKGATLILQVRAPRGGASRYLSISPR